MDIYSNNIFEQLNLAVIGTGYVGLVSGVCLAECGHKVHCVDIDEAKIELLQKGQSPIYEQGLDVLLANNLASGHITFTTDLIKAVKGADIIMIAVGTPADPLTRAPNLEYVEKVTTSLAPILTNGQVVVVKSTSPIGTAHHLKKFIQSKTHVSFSIATNPEFLREGSAVKDFMQPDRIVIGTEDQHAQTQLTKLYASFRNKAELLQTDLASAEMIKYAANAFLATKITFINEVANLCEKVGADVDEVALGMGLDQRIGRDFLEAGPGFGGTCFPKDTLALAYVGKQHGVRQHIVETVTCVNDARLNMLHQRITHVFKDDLKNKVIAFWGVTFKPLTDDMRDAPALKVIPNLQALGATCIVYDPQAKKTGEALLPGVKWATTALEAVEAANALCLLTHWPEFYEKDLSQVAASMRTAHLIDLRNVFNVEKAKEAGFLSYASVGRKNWVASNELLLQ